jgi:Mg-chelatase subunit ChlD
MKGKHMSNPNPAPQKGTHIYKLVDRSGSMESIAGDVIGGFNHFLREQQANGDDARITVIQFDSQNPAEVIAAGIPIREMTEMTSQTFIPRGGTPLLDATGSIISRARAEAVARKAANLPEEDIIIVTITDGEENQSVEYSLQQVRDLIGVCESAGWVFVYLSAALDAYGDAQRMGVHSGATQQFSHSADGSRRGFDSLSRNMVNLREKKRRGEYYDSSTFFETGKDAEDE